MDFAGIVQWLQDHTRPTPAHDGPTARTLTQDIRVARLQAAWHTVPAGHPDEAALMVLDGIASTGDSSRMARRIRDRGGLVTGVGSWPSHDRLAGTFNVWAECQPGVPAEVSPDRGIR